MTHRARMSSLLGLALATLVVGFPPPAPAADSPPDGTKRALLIGINRYQVLPSLNGSLNDIETMRHVLTTRWGFQPQHITTLTDQAATRAGDDHNLAVKTEFVGHGAPFSKKLILESILRGPPVTLRFHSLERHQISWWSYQQVWWC